MVRVLPLERSVAAAHARGRKRAAGAGGWIRAWGLALVLVALVACGTTATFILQQYQGAIRPAEEIAILRINGGEGPEIASLDGKTMGVALTDKTARIHIEMLPGMHRLSVANPAEFGRPSEVWFKAEAQRVYRAALVSVPVLRSGGRTRSTVRGAVYEVDRESDQLIEDVSVVPKTRFPEAPEPSESTPPSAPEQPQSGASPEAPQQLEEPQGEGQTPLIEGAAGAAPDAQAITPGGSGAGGSVDPGAAGAPSAGPDAAE